MYHDYFCKIYINGVRSIEELTNLLSNFLSLTPDHYNSIESDFYIIDIMKNKEFDNEKINSHSDGFLYYPYFLDVDLNNKQKTKEYIEMISNLLNFFWNKNLKVVAACDFEDELPHNGGYLNGVNFNN